MLAIGGNSPITIVVIDGQLRDGCPGAIHLHALYLSGNFRPQLLAFSIFVCFIVSIIN